MYSYVPRDNNAHTQHIPELEKHTEPQITSKLSSEIYEGYTNILTATEVVRQRGS